jgi:predicted nucleic acid-binding protein
VSPDRGLIDTSVAIGFERIDPGWLPAEVAISTLTLAELTLGPHATRDRGERARRQEHLQRVEATFEPLPFDPDCARATGRVCAAIALSGRKAGGSRFVDLMIAATALAHGLALYTRDASDLRGLDDLIEVVDLA